MKTNSSFTSRQTLLVSAAGLLTAGSLFGACTGEFTYDACPEGTVQTAGGGDISEACQPIGGAGGAAGAGSGGQADAGAGGQPGAGAGGAGQGGAAGGAAAAGQGGSSGSSAGASGAPTNFTIDQVALSAGSTHTCVSNPGALRCWGRNGSGQLGSTVNQNTGNSTPNPVPFLVENAGLGVVRQLALGDQHTCALRDDGRVLCWGRNSAGQLGTGANIGSADGTPVPALIESGAMGTSKQVAAGYLHGCALRDDGRVLCWGNNYFGQLGISANTASENPTEPALLDVGNLGVVRQLALGERHTCALRNDGRVLCWGRNHFGQLGDPNINDYESNEVPRLIENSALGVVQQIAVGLNHGCALRDDGRVLCWGNNRDGQLGKSTNVGTDVANATPTLVESSLIGVVRGLALGQSHSCALRDDGRVLCWGANYSGQLGVEADGQVGSPYVSPIVLSNSVLGTVHQLVAGKSHTCALRDDGQVLCWGNNRFGQLGMNTNAGTDDAIFVPTPVQELPRLIP